MFLFSEKCIVFENYNGNYEFRYLSVMIQVKNLPRRCHCHGTGCLPSCDSSFSRSRLFTVSLLSKITAFRFFLLCTIVSFKLELCEFTSISRSFICISSTMWIHYFFSLTCDSLLMYIHKLHTLPAIFFTFVFIYVNTAHLHEWIIENTIN